MAIKELDRFFVSQVVKMKLPLIYRYNNLSCDLLVKLNVIDQLNQPAFAFACLCLLLLTARENNVEPDLVLLWLTVKLNSARF